MKTDLYIEYLHPDFWPGELTHNLTLNEPEIIDGSLMVSNKPDLGIELNVEYITALTGKEL